jgi:hypothetical protein
MTRKRQRLGLVALGMAALAGATALVLTAFSANIVFFFSPSDLKTQAISPDRRVRIGGLVEDRSVQRGAGSRIAFRITRPTSPSSITGSSPICSAKGRVSSPKESWNRTESLMPRPSLPSMTSDTCRAKWSRR